MDNKAFDNQDIESASRIPENVEPIRDQVNDADVVTSEDNLDLLYTVEDVPPWYMCILLGVQHYLTAFGGNLMQPIIVANTAFCMNGDSLGISELISTNFFVSGLSTLLQTTFGCRLPIMQGASFSFLMPVIALFSMEQCPYANSLPVNSTLVIGNDEHREFWKNRIRLFQGCLMVGSLIQVVIGFSGLMELFLSFVGPLTIMPTITLIGLALFEVAADYSSSQWYIALMTSMLICIFSQYMKNINIPCFVYKKGKGCTTIPLSLFKMFPVLFAILTAWLLCYILTVTDVFPKEAGKWGHEARTDIFNDVLEKSAWFRFPYPGQWGLPLVSTAGVLGIFAAVFSSIIESVGDYYACARMAGAPPPPVHAINRGIGMEGITCLLAGAWGAPSGNTSYSENIGAIGITKIGSRRVVQVGAFLMIILGCLGKFGALFVTIPRPVVGGMFLVMFGMVAAIGISNLKHVSLDSSRNLFIIGTSILVGLALPLWVHKNPQVIKTGSTEFDQIVSVLLGTNMFVGGFLGLFFDNTLPGTDEERGLSYWKKMREQKSSEENTKMNIYDLPNCIQTQLNKIKCLNYLPFCPGYNSFFSRSIKRMCSCKTTGKRKSVPINNKK